MKKTICVDLDGVLADYSKGWQGVDHIGDPIPGAVEFVKKLNELGRVVIFTSRCSSVHKDCTHAGVQVACWLQKHGFEYDEIYMGQGKPIASAYIDDRAIHCDPGRAIDEEDRDAEWDYALRRVKRLTERNDGFVSDSGITV